MKKTFKLGYLFDRGLPNGFGDGEGVIMQHRWATEYYGVFEHEGKHYQCSFYSKDGSRNYFSENEESKNDEYYREQDIECVEVKKIQVMINKWVPIEEEL